MPRHIICLLLLFPTSYCVLRQSCFKEDIISWSSGRNAETRAVNLTACSYGSYRFQLDRPFNSSKSIRARIVSQEEDSETKFDIQVFEMGVAADGTPMILKRKDLNGVDDSIISSPYTSLKINVYKRGVVAKAELIFHFTLEDNGCPYPFLESHKGIPTVITSEVLEYECDFSLAAVDPGTTLELTSINESIPHQRHSIAVVVYDGFTFSRLHRVEQSEFDTDLKEHLGTSRVIVHVTNPMGRTKNSEVAFITFNSIDDDCRCPEGNVILNETTSDLMYKREKMHCFHLNCTVNIQIAESLRHEYRLKVEPVYYEGATDAFSVRDGLGQFLNMRYVTNPPVYVSIHPTILLSFTESSKPIRDYAYISLLRTTEKEQALCDCPAFNNNNLEMTIDPSCPPFDCIWAFDKIQYEYVPTIAVETNSTGEYDSLQIISTDEKNERVQLLQNGDYEHLYFPWEDDIVMPHVLLHFHRFWRNNPFTGEKQSTASHYKLLISHHYNQTEYAHACGCFNQTITLDPSKELNFSSPRFPSHYCDDLYCRTVFEAPKGYRVVFKPYRLSLQKGSDFLNLYEVIDGQEVRREQYTGTYLDGFTTESRASTLIAVFTSDAAITYDGFNSSVYAAKIEDDSVDYFDDSTPSSKSSGWFWKICLCLLLIGGIVGGVVYKKRKTEGFSLSFAPVSFMNNGGDFDEGSISFNFNN